MNSNALKTKGLLASKVHLRRDLQASAKNYKENGENQDLNPEFTHVSLDGARVVAAFVSEGELMLTLKCTERFVTLPAHMLR